MEYLLVSVPRISVMKEHWLEKQLRELYPQYQTGRGYDYRSRTQEYGWFASIRVIKEIKWKLRWFKVLKIRNWAGIGAGDIGEYDA